MAGMQGLGRVFDVVHDASGNMFSFKNASAVTFISKSSGSNTLTLVAAKVFGGSTTAWTTANGFGQTGFYYENAGAIGTAAWTKQTASWSSNVLTLGTSGKVDVVTVYTSQVADTYAYIQGTAAAGDLIAVLHDLTVSRDPRNLAILGA
ncbi:MAG TPA: hypothetical protein VFU74_21940 [Actinocrinis sp.]|nr:hypothetical protein [Actinocrinis sp.]